MADFFRRYVLHNLGLKLLSLVLAVGLWVAVARDPIAEVAVSVPIEFHRITDPVDATGTVERASFTTHAYVSDPLVQLVRPAPVRVTVIMEKIRSSSGGF